MEPNQKKKTKTMTTKEKIEVMQAYLDGKQIQSKVKKPRYSEEAGWGDWVSHKEPVWDFWSCDYRIKPEPRTPIEGWAVLYRNGNMGSVHKAQDFAERLGQDPDAERVVHFREVIEDDQI